MAVIEPYPTREHGGAVVSVYYEHDPDWDKLTDVQEFDDDGISTNTNGDVPTLRWTLNYQGLPPVERNIHDGHRALAQGKNNTFSFTDREGVTHTGVRYERYERVPHQKQWSQDRTVVLVKYPA